MKNLKNFLLISNGLAGDGLAYGALTDLPDWSFVGKFNSKSYNIFGCLSCNCLPSLCHVIADGEAAPETKRRKKRGNKRLCESVSSALIIEVSQANITSALV
jgi:hypothetical protein